MLRLPPLPSVLPPLPLLATSWLIAGSLLGGCAWIPASRLDEALNRLGDIDLELSTVPQDWDACLDTVRYSGTVEGRYALEVFDATLMLDDTVLASERVSASAAEDGRAEVTVDFEPVVGLPLEGGAVTLTVTFEHGDGASESDTFDVQITPAPTRYEDGDADGVGGAAFFTCDPTQGVATDGDCDDSDPNRTPGAEELCDGIDNNCDDELSDLEADADGDGYTLCDPVEPDCDDTDMAIHPGIIEDQDLADNGVDENCDGADLCWTDFDGDGFAATAPGTLVYFADYPGGCAEALADTGPDAPNVTAAPANDDLIDCDDTETVDPPVIYPGATELCDGIDNDCDGMMPGEEDSDGDGFFACDDCEDTVPSVNPGAVSEICDGYDTDCSEDGIIPADEVDLDGDGYAVCTPPIGSTFLGDDCADDPNIEPAAADIYPTAPELCDGVDNDCDDVVPPDETVDSDGDGFLECADCDDDDSAINPDAEEAAGNDVDENCDSLWDCIVDADQDGSGDETGTVAPDQPMMCSGIVGVSANSSDCDDADPDIYLNAPELCDGLDNDCDGDVPLDEQDTDGDGYVACAVYIGSEPFLGGDCEPDLPQAYPGADELCTPLNENCDPLDDGYDGALHIGIIPDADPDATEGFDAFPAGWTSNQPITIEVCGETQQSDAQRVLIDSDTTIVGMTTNPVASLGVSLEVQSANVTIQELDLQLPAYVDTENGGVVHHTGTGLLTIEDVHIDCAAGPPPAEDVCDPEAPTGDIPVSGGAIWSPNLEMTTVDISNCWSSGSGGAVFVEGQATLTDVDLHHNFTDGSGGAIATQIGSSLFVLDSRLDANGAGVSGGGIALGASTSLDITGTPGDDFISNNQACTYGAGIAAPAQNDVAINGMDLISNIAGEGGGGLYMVDGDGLTVSNTLFQTNEVSAVVANPDATQLAAGDGGGAWITMDGGVDATIDTSTFVGNIANRGGGLAGQTSFAGILSIETTDFIANHETAVYLSSGNGSAELKGVLFDRNWTTLADGSASALHSRLNEVFLDDSTSFLGNAVIAASSGTSGLMYLHTDAFQSLCACETQLGSFSSTAWPTPGVPPDEFSSDSNYELVVVDNTTPVDQVISGTTTMFCSGDDCVEDVECIGDYPPCP